jgi:hypothetical protein
MGQYADLSVDQIQKAGNVAKEQKAAGNVAATREVQGAVAGTQPSMVESYFAEESKKRKQSYALTDARDQTSQMQTAMKMQQENFDSAFKNERRLSAISKGADKQLLSAEKEFKFDSMGRKMLSERQLADWYTTRAATEEDWANYQQASEQMHERRMLVLTASYNKILQMEKQAYAAGAAALDRDTQTAIARAKADLSRKLEDQRKKAANSSVMISALGTVGTVAGGIVGTIVGKSPMAGAAGAAAGGMVGTAAGKALS